MEKKYTHGGARKGAGAPKKAEQVQANKIFLSAIKEALNADNDEEARKVFAKDLLTFERGKMFIAEHLFGKAPQEIKQTNFNIEAKDLDEEEIKKISETLNNAY